VKRALTGKWMNCRELAGQPGVIGAMFVESRKSGINAENAIIHHQFAELILGLTCRLT